MNRFWLLLLSILMFSCGKSEIRISDLSGTNVGNFASNELTRYFSEIYPGTKFSHTANNERADVLFMLTDQAGAFGLTAMPQTRESFAITPKDGQLLVVAPDERGLLNAAYALLEEQGSGFYISGDIIPQKKWAGFEGMEMSDAPLTGERVIFNWHNFLSGCTGWDLEHWKQWIDQANKMRYNTIMVHAYGNNPMFTFEHLGERKVSGYLNNTASGRDWGNQHINDVRRMVAGEIFDAPVFGATASFASEEKKEKEAIELMQQVFQHAEDRGTRIIFALDFDTWMANPQNIIRKMPAEAVFEINGFLTPNPDHPAGFEYYKQQLIALTDLYPQIDQLSVWHRRPSFNPGLGTIWMNFSYDIFPPDWKMEYDRKMAENPHLERNIKSTSMFAYGKLIEAIQRARDEVKPELEISSGSWRFHFIKFADAFFPSEVPLFPLDWEIVFDEPDAIETLRKAGSNRDMYPIIWAHHDDHRYIGRPYTPWSNLADRLRETNSKGFGIIHWTTHPLDLYFTSSGRQVWERTMNEPLKTTVENYVATNFGSGNDELVRYYYDWVTTGPMFGRETSNHFVDLGGQRHGHDLEPWEVMAEKTRQRLAILNEIPGLRDNDYLQYQKAMEEFYISFFDNQIMFREAYDLARNHQIDEARALLSGTNPREAIQRYADAHKIIGFTRGEMAMVFSMNTRWLVDYMNLGQRLGMEPIRFLFSPTNHDPLAQSPGRNTYWVDEDGNWWRSLWEHEISHCCFSEDSDPPALIVEDRFDMPLTTMHGQSLLAGGYELRLDYHAEVPFAVSIIENGYEIAEAVFPSGSHQGALTFHSSSGAVELVISSEDEMKLHGVSLFFVL